MYAEKNTTVIKLKSSSTPTRTITATVSTTAKNHRVWNNETNKTTANTISKIHEKAKAKINCY